MKLFVWFLILTTTAAVKHGEDGNEEKNHELPEILTKLGFSRVSGFPWITHQPLVNVVTAPLRWMSRFLDRWKNKSDAGSTQTEPVAHDEIGGSDSDEIDIVGNEDYDSDYGNVGGHSSVDYDENNSIDFGSPPESGGQQSVHSSAERDSMHWSHDRPVETHKSQLCMSVYDMADFKKEILRLHNVKRSEHQADDLDPSDDLDKVAQKWAEHYSDVGKHERRPPPDHMYPDDQEFGENVFVGYVYLNFIGPPIRAEDVINEWYNESKNYNYDPPNDKCCEHFTQMVWKDTQEVGFGCAKKRNGPVYVVAVYLKAGNKPLLFTKNVRSPKLEEDNKEENTVTGMSQHPCMSPTDMIAFRAELLRLNNEKRDNHHADHLTSYDYVHSMAQELADEIAETGKYELWFVRNGWGQNIFVDQFNEDADPLKTAKDVIKNWYDESNHYNYDNPKRFCCQRFTQMVWKNSKTVGYGCAKLEDGALYVVASYHESGNIPSFLIKENVIRPGGHQGKVHAQTKTRTYPCMPSTELMATFRADLLHFNNEKRNEHQAKELKPNPQLQLAAQAFADGIVDGRDYKLYQCDKYGVNVHIIPPGGPARVTGAEVIDEWYLDSALYSYTNPFDCCHRFTQMVWKGSGSVEVGFGCARASMSGMIFVVAAYSECGNNPELFTKNIGRPIVQPGPPSENQNPQMSNPARLNKAKHKYPKYVPPDGIPKHRCFDDDALAKFRDEILPLHNEKRRLHGAEKLTVSELLEKAAQKLADSNVDYGRYQSAKPIYADSEFVARGRTGPNPVTAEEVIERWYSESKVYFANAKCLYKDCGHFVQMVWKPAKEIGYGCAKSTDGTVYVIAVFDIAASFELRPDNVGEFVSEPSE